MRSRTEGRKRKVSKERLLGMSDRARAWGKMGAGLSPLCQLAGWGLPRQKQCVEVAR